MLLWRTVHVDVHCLSYSCKLTDFSCSISELEIFHFLNRACSRSPHILLFSPESQAVNIFSLKLCQYKADSPLHTVHTPQLYAIRCQLPQHYIFLTAYFQQRSTYTSFYSHSISEYWP